MDKLEDSGKTVGMLNASNTIGSILGTFLPTFVTIPSVGTLLFIICCIFGYSDSFAFWEPEHLPSSAENILICRQTSR